MEEKLEEESVLAAVWWHHSAWEELSFKLNRILPQQIQTAGQLQNCDTRPPMEAVK